MTPASPIALLRASEVGTPGVTGQRLSARR
jgi:hypothetical protein